MGQFGFLRTLEREQRAVDPRLRLTAFQSSRLLLQEMHPFCNDLLTSSRTFAEVRTKAVNSLLLFCDTVSVLPVVSLSRVRFRPSSRLTN